MASGRLPQWLYLLVPSSLPTGWSVITNCNLCTDKPVPHELPCLHCLILDHIECFTGLAPSLSPHSSLPISTWSMKTFFLFVSWVEGKWWCQYFSPLSRARKFPYQLIQVLHSWYFPFSFWSHFYVQSYCIHW